VYDFGIKVKHDLDFVVMLFLAETKLPVVFIM
jgi:hypothetical protein